MRRADQGPALEAEARFLQALDHPGFPSVVGWLTAPGDPYRRLVMTCAEGGDLFTANRCSPA